MLAAYALTPRDMATSIRGDTIADGPRAAAAAYRQAGALTANDAERAFLDEQLAARSQGQ